MAERLLDKAARSGRWLVVVAAPAEARAVLDGLGAGGAEAEPWILVRANERVDLVVSGVGKANAAGATARVFDPSAHAGVISLGIGGALPSSGLSIGDSVVGSRSIYADEGVLAPGGFQDVAAMGFAPGDGVSGVAGHSWVEGAPGIIACLEPVADATGAIATVSTCSGTDAGATSIEGRTGAIVEAMEGAAVGFSAARLFGGPPSFCEVRLVSNTTGDRESQRWDLAGALDRLRGVASFL